MTERLDGNEVALTEKTTADAAALAARTRLHALFDASPLPGADLLFNLGLYVRSSLLVKFLVMNDLYTRIRSVPGALLEFGVWYGQNLVLLENLRAIHEPFNKQRPIVGFDTFDGYGDAIGKSADEGDSFYNTGHKYKTYLIDLLAAHEASNAFGHVSGDHRLVQGDVTLTAPQFFREHPETLVALAYFDMGPYEPTKAALEAIRPHLVPGSVLLFDELTWPGAPGEAIAFKEVFRGADYAIEKSIFYPSKSIVTIHKA